MALNDGQDRFYYGAGDIFGVFRALQAERSRVNVQFDDGAQLYNTMILDANLAERYFLMDEITPRDGRRKIEDGASFSIRASINGIKVHARDLVRSRILKNADGIYYQIAFPAKMLYLQRREAFRAYVPGSMSATGIHVTFPGKIEPDLQLNERFDALIRIQALEQNVDMKIEIAYYEYNRERNQTMYGCRIVDLQRADQIIINRYVTFLQREELV